LSSVGAFSSIGRPSSVRPSKLARRIGSIDDSAQIGSSITPWQSSKRRRADGSS